MRAITTHGLLERARMAVGPDREIDRDLYFALYCIPNEGQINGVIGRALPAGRYPYLMPASFCPTDGTMAPAFTGSMDAARAMLKDILPGWIWRVAECSVSDDAWVVPDFNDPVHGQRLQAQFPAAQQDPIEYFNNDIDRRPSGQPALALIEAILVALIKIEELANIEEAEVG